MKDFKRNLIVGSISLFIVNLIYSIHKYNYIQENYILAKYRFPEYSIIPSAIVNTILWAILIFAICCVYVMIMSLITNEKTD